MSRIVVVGLLLILLADSFCSSTAAHAGFNWPKALIRKCRCKASPDGKLKCPIPLFPTNDGQKRTLIKCLCSKKNQYKFSKFEAPCKYRHPSTPL